jgi:hypothetical protein
MSLTVQPFKKWDIERFFYTDPILSTTERFVAIQLLKSLDDKFRPVRANLHSQALIGYRVHAWRETVNRVVRKLVLLGYFRARWTTVNRQTKQGIKGVTRVMVELGPILRKLVDDAGQTISPSQARGVMSHHPSPTPPGGPMSLGAEVVTKSAGSNGATREDTAKFRRETLAQFKRLAEQRPPSASRLPSSTPFAELTERRDGAELPSTTELSDAEYAERIRKSRARMAALGQRSQPRRKPRSDR